MLFRIPFTNQCVCMDGSADLSYFGGSMVDQQEKIISWVVIGHSGGNGSMYDGYDGTDVGTG